MKGVSECVFRAPVGKATVVCTFKDGNLQSREPVPATFTTENPIVQAVIESCELYASRKIFLMASYGEPDVVLAPAKAEPKKVAEKVTEKPKTKKADLKVMEEVKTIADAVTVLAAEGVPASEFDGTAAGAHKVAKSLGLSFPNLKD